MTAEIHEVDNLATFLDHLLSQPQNSSPFWFRGMSDSRWKLMPTLHRRLSLLNSPDVLGVERRLITRFRQRSLPLWPEGYPQTDWEQLFAMQHYGMPTRLLDWTENPLTAAYFAVTSNLFPFPDTQARPVVWQLDPVSLNRANKRFEVYGDEIAILATSDKDADPWSPGTDSIRFPPGHVAIYGTHNSSRIVAQQGTFTVAGKSFTALEDTSAVLDQPEILSAYTFTCDHKALLSDLAKLSVRRGNIYPDLTSIAHDISEMELPS